MSKEMIISVNGREKKIAILDDGKVTEFYIERGEDNSGVVGNIYKGRVQRVLPGMQSAFVGIGLERDAFLYVSDFFDEEEEIERIVMEKSKKSSPEDARREADERIERARLEREKQMEAVQDIAEPMAEANVEASDDGAGRIEEFQPRGKYKDKRRGRKDRNEEFETKTFEKISDEKISDEKISDHSAAEFSDVNADEEAAEEMETEVFAEARKEEYTPVYELEDSNFERIIDEEETTGDMFKDAYMQEAIVDKVRAVEFDMESTGAAEVGSLIGSVKDGPNGFQRIADEDEEEPAQAEKGSRRSRGGKGRNKAGNENRAAAENPASAETSASENDTKLEDKNPARGKRRNSRKSEKSEKPEKNKKSDVSSAEPTENANSDETRAEASGKTARGKKSSRKPKKSGSGETLEDAQASVRESNDAAEMAVRRGGRGGRNRRGGTRGGRGQERTEDGTDTVELTDEHKENEFVEEPEEILEKETQSIGAEREFQAPRGGRNFQSGGNGGANRRDRNDRNDRSDRNDRDRRPQPTITDLLREGQEILVQIAKEPIARKGARITSHIALPGRFLVYMPTIEHLGVSRKIESASERSRLRTLIQKIRQSEEIPSGGFIVRTAGTGISEEDLRQDARYLVRTWTDIKKTADKSKSPALVHQDLDIIQRLLRDQLSDEFSAIRVDSEEEYLRIIEFVNRIQPRMTTRVKLYTREDPILEAFGVQEEIDKALKPRVWLKSGGYLVINQTEALVAIDVNTGKFVGKGNARLEDTITKTNMEAVDEIARQIRLRDLGGIIVLDLIDMEDRRNRNKVAQALQEALSTDKSPTKVLSFNDFGLIIMTRKRVKQSLERTMCAPCEYCEGAGWIKSPQTVCYEILEEARRLSKSLDDVRQTTLRIHPDVAESLRKSERAVLEEIEAYLGNVDITADRHIHQAQFDFAFI
jgi:ribonuclease G